MGELFDTKSILIVEDEAVTLDHLFLILSYKYPHYTIYKASDGKLGKEMFIKHTPEVVVTDLTMPVMDGIQMATAIHAISPSTKFVFLTGDIEKNVSEVCTKRGMIFHHIVKPVLFEELFDAIDKCMNEI